MRAVCFGGVLNLPLFVRVPALAFVHPELFWHRVLHGAAVLPPQLVVRNPPVLRCSFAVAGQFGFGVDGCLGVVVLHPPGMPQVPDVHVQALEGDARGDDAVQLAGLDLGVEQAVAQRRAVNHLGLGTGDCAVALQGRKVAPQGGGKVIFQLLIRNFAVAGATYSVAESCTSY